MIDWLVLITCAKLGPASEENGVVKAYLRLEDVTAPQQMAGCAPQKLAKAKNLQPYNIVTLQPQTDIRVLDSTGSPERDGSLCLLVFQNL